jgi:ketosteroid isomerase-like protein
MSQENVEIVRRSIEAWNRRDLTTGSALWRSDAEIDWSRARGPLKRVYRGYGGRETFWDEFLSTFEDAQLETHGFTQAGAEVVVPNTAHLSGARRDRSDCEEHFRVHGRERADHSPSDVPGGSRGPRSGRAVGVGRSLLDLLLGLALDRLVLGLPMGGQIERLLPPEIQPEPRPRARRAPERFGEVERLITQAHLDLDDGADAAVAVLPPPGDSGCV